MSKYRKQDIETLLRLQLGEAEKAKINAQQTVERLRESRQCAETYMLILADKLQFSSSQFSKLSSGWCEELVNAIAGLQIQLAAAQALADQATRLGNAALADMQSKADLWRDEFRRIKALTTDGEIAGICDRAQQDIERHVPITVEVEQLQQQVAQLREWRANVTVALQRPGGAFFDDVAKHIKDLVEQHTTLRGLVEKLPCFDGEIKVKTYHHESDRGQEWDEYECGDAGFDNLEAANVYAALLTYRATLLRERHSEECVCGRSADEATGNPSQDHNPDCPELAKWRALLREGGAQDTISTKTLPSQYLGNCAEVKGDIS